MQAIGERETKETVVEKYAIRVTVTTQRMPFILFNDVWSEFSCILCVYFFCVITATVVGVAHFFLPVLTMKIRDFFLYIQHANANLFGIWFLVFLQKKKRNEQLTNTPFVDKRA